MSHCVDEGAELISAGTGTGAGTVMYSSCTLSNCKLIDHDIKFFYCLEVIVFIAVPFLCVISSCYCNPIG